MCVCVCDLSVTCISNFSNFNSISWLYVTLFLPVVSLAVNFVIVTMFSILLPLLVLSHSHLSETCSLMFLSYIYYIMLFGKPYGKKLLSLCLPFVPIMPGTFAASVLFHLGFMEVYSTVLITVPVQRPCHCSFSQFYQNIVFH